MNDQFRSESVFIILKTLSKLHLDYFSDIKIILKKKFSNMSLLTFLQYCELLSDFHKKLSPTLVIDTINKHYLKKKHYKIEDETAKLLFYHFGNNIRHMFFTNEQKDAVVREINKKIKQKLKDSF